MKLRSRMTVLALGAMAPLLVLALLVGLLLLHQQRKALERDAVGRVRAAMTAMDAELRGSLSTLQALASSQNLAEGDLQAFHREMRRVLDSQLGWINISLIAPDNSQRFHALEPVDSTVPGLIDKATFDATVTSRRAAIGNVSYSPTVHTATVHLLHPIYAQGELRHVLGISLKLERFADVLRAQRLPDTWVIAMLDREHRFIVRIPHREPGELSSQSFRDAIASAPEGFFAGQTKDGLLSYTAYVTSPLSGWVLGIAMPRDELQTGQWQLAIGLGTGGLLAVIAALALSRVFGRRISQPVAELADASEALQRGDPVLLGSPSSIAELRSLQRALAQAATAVGERQALQEREKAALRSADRAKDEFLAMLSHELRNPLSALVAASQLLRHMKAPDPVAERACGVIDRQTRHMARLVDDLLDVSRTMMGKVELKREPLDLAELVRSAMEGWRVAGRFAQHEVSLEADGPAPVHADRVRLEQVLSNLVDNALKFTPGGGQVSVRVLIEPGHAVLEVRDTGRGFAPGAQAWMFDLFKQGEQGLDRHQGGMGIGLAMVRRLADMHGGTVAARSEGPGHGATFIIHLPLAEG
jgi:signal transduction histidine kinase